MCTKVHLSYTNLSEPMASKIDSYFGVKNSLVEVHPGNVLVPQKYSEIGDRILDFKVRKDDVWLISLPRTGSTWTQEMVWLLDNNLDYEGAKTIQHYRTPLLELSAVLGPEGADFYAHGNSVDFVEEITTTRYIKSHLPVNLLPRELFTVKPKIIYVARNPKDMCVSFYYYCKLVHGLQATFEDFCELLLTDKAPMCPLWSHILAFWNMRDEPNVLFITYEEMKRDLTGHIRKTAKFLGKEITEEQITELEEHLSFNSMKKNPAVNLKPVLERLQGKDHMEKTGISFIRKGQVGDYKNYMSEEITQRFDEWMEENLQGTGLSFN